MIDKQLNKIIEKIKKTSDSNYKIAKETGITEATIGNYKNGKTTPTKANLKLLLKYFSDRERSNQIIKGDNNYMAGKEMRINNSKDDEIQNLRKQIEIQKKQLIEKDKIIKQLLEQQKKLINKL